MTNRQKSRLALPVAYAACVVVLGAIINSDFRRF